jgi:hypothetical protein
MFFIPHFIYEDGAGAAGGAPVDAPVKPDQQQPEPVLTAADLKELGFDNVDSLKSLVKSAKENNISPEEKAKKDNVEKANLLKYAAENGIMNVEDYNKRESLKGKADRDLVFDRFSSEHKEDFPDASDEDVREAFESEYKLNSDSDKSKARGEARLSKEAKELRTPFEQKYTVAEQKYTEHKALEGKFPEFNKFMDSLIEKCTPEKMTFAKVKDGDAEVEIEVELSKKDREEIAKAFRTPKAFQAFIGETDPAKVEQTLSKKINGFLKEKYFDSAISQGYEKGKSVGIKNGSNIGAENPYALNKDNKNKAQTPVIDIKASNDKIAGARERYRNSR